MIFYAINLGILTGLCVLHFILYKALAHERSQFLILAVCICYGLITILKRMVSGTVVDEFIAQILAFVLMTAVFILIAKYVSLLMNLQIYSMYSWFFYGTMIVVFIFGSVIYAVYSRSDFYYIGLSVLSLEYVGFSVFFMYKERFNLQKDKIVFLIATYIMIISFMILAIMTVLDIKEVYWCAIGVFVYIITAEIVSIRRVIIRMRTLSENGDNSEHLTAKEEEIYSMMQAGISPKEIAMKTDLAVTTVYKYQQSILRKKKI